MVGSAEPASHSAAALSHSAASIMIKEEDVLADQSSGYVVFLSRLAN